MDDGFQITRLFVGVVAGQGAQLDRMLGAREQGDAVARLHADRGDLIAEAFDLHARQFLVQALDLLQQDDIGRGALQPPRQVRHAHP